MWPVSVNGTGQVAGTLFTEGLPGQAIHTDAFQWQSGTMVLLAAA